MKKKYKIISIIGLIIALGIIFFKPTYSINDLLTSKIVDGIEINNINIDTKEDISTYTATIKALEEKEINYIEIEVSNKKEKYTLIGYIGKTLKENEETIITASIDYDISNMTDINYQIK